MLACLLDINHHRPAVDCLVLVFSPYGGPQRGDSFAWANLRERESDEHQRQAQSESCAQTPIDDLALHRRPMTKPNSRRRANDSEHKNVSGRLCLLAGLTCDRCTSRRAAGLARLTNVLVWPMAGCKRVCLGFSLVGVWRAFGIIELVSSLRGSDLRMGQGDVVTSWRSPIRVFAAWSKYKHKWQQQQQANKRNKSIISPNNWVGSHANVN